MAKWRGSKGQLGKIKINRAAVDALIRDRVETAWAEVMAKLDVEYMIVIEDPNEFSNLGFFDQDIVDTGRFRDSQKVNVTGRKAFWQWDPISPDNGYHYGPALYYGFHPFGMDGQDGKPYAYVPGRHWIDRAIKRVNPVKSFAAELRKNGLQAKVVRNNNSLLD